MADLALDDHLSVRAPHGGHAMKVLVAIPAKELQAGDHLAVVVPTPIPDSPFDVTEVKAVFDSGHGRIQITLARDEIGWFNADDLMGVLREFQ